MLIDKTYTPLRTDFDDVVKRKFKGCHITARQRKSLEVMFYAGAASAYAIMAEKERHATIRDELLDHASLMEREGI
ncbi:hypothetical protein G6M87_11020 [Rhizobium rhizogenes]|uniref:hypothetical protein n=1 Tax=Rhizobium rhizogenes TaxID=359 RepID=UPI001573F5EC|nr:hypothetical protein [Rhizobium rhizogenes]NTI22389.1 hypothetical protein [Rhizobium rhizogenes]QTG05974.1 hypothetical protein G6M87_11020 [Rhizobium rhizogenes]